MSWVLQKLVRFYQLAIGPLLPRTCRFLPSCSAYALEALRLHGAARGSWFTLRRLSRCHPWCRPGYDPVPGSTLEAEFAAIERERAIAAHDPAERS